MIDIFLGNNYTRYIGDLSPYAIEQLKERMSYVKMGAEHTEKFQSGEWDGRIHLFKVGESFYTGLLSIFVSTLKECGLEHRVFDRRQMASENFPELKFSRPSYAEEREYQDFTVTRSISLTRGILNIGTGGGKTFVAAEIIGRLKVKPFMFYVLTRDLLYQAKESLESCLNCKIGQIGDGVCDIQDINVCTKDAVVYALNHGKKGFDIKNYKFDECDAWDEKEVFGTTDRERIVDVVSNCRGMYFDEVHHASSRTAEDIIVASPKAYWRFGGTATLEREDGEELVIQGLFGRKIVDISLSYLIKNNWLVPAGVFFVPVVVNNVPFNSYHKIYHHCVIDNADNAKEVADLAQYLASLGKSNLILVSKIPQGKNIKSLIPKSVFLTGKDSSKKRNKAIEDMRSGALKIMIATTLADEGLDIKCLDVVHMVGAGASITRVPQRIGRVLRLSPATNKKYGIAVYYQYCTEYLYDQGLKAKRIVKSEPALDYVQTNDYKDLRVKILRYMQSKEPSLL